MERIISTLYQILTNVKFHMCRRCIADCLQLALVEIKNRECRILLTRLPTIGNLRLPKSTGEGHERKY